TVGSAVLEKVDEREGVDEVTVSKHEVLVVLDAPLTVEVDVEQLVLEECLGDASGEVEARHLLVAHLRVQADELGVVERLDEAKGVADGGQQNVAAGLVWLGLNGELDVVAVVDDVLTKDVGGLAVALERDPRVLGEVVLGTLATAPHDEGLCAELGSQVDV